jgi:hypothetical protein
VAQVAAQQHEGVLAGAAVVAGLGRPHEGCEVLVRVAWRAEQEERAVAEVVERAERAHGERLVVKFDLS